MFIVQQIPRTVFFWKYKRFLKKDSIDLSKPVMPGGGSIVRIDVYDVLNNKETHELIKKIGKLKKSNFKTKLYYKKRKFKSLNYIRPQFDHTSLGLFADITPLNNEFINSINLHWTQINNDEAVMQYSFTLRKPIRTVNDCKNMAVEHWNMIKSVKTVPHYKSIDSLTSDTNQNNRYIYNLFLSVCQGFVNKELYTNLGHRYQLPVNVVHLAKNKTAVNRIIKDGFLYRLYKKDKKNVYIGQDVTEQWQTDTFIIGDRYSGEDLLGYFSKYAMDYYYLIFGHIEVDELSRRLVGYLNKGKTKISYKNRVWLLRKFRRVSEVKLFSKKIESSGLVGVTSDVGGQEYIQFGLAKKFRDVYEDNLKYINSVFGLTDIHIWAKVLLIVSLLGLLVSGVALANDLFDFIPPAKG